MSLGVAREEPARQPSEVPHSIEAEQALIGALLSEPGGIQRIGQHLGPHHFFEPALGRLFEAIQAASAQGSVVDAVLVSEAVSGDPAFQELGGLSYLGQLILNAPPIENAPEYARAIFDLAMRRDVLAICHTGAKAAATANDGSAFEVISEIRRAIEAVEHDAAPEDISMIDAPKAAAKAIEAMQERAVSGRPRGLMTGLRCVDRRLNGLRGGAMFVMGGRPGMMKTGLARAIMHGAAVRNPNRLFLFIGIEMGPEEMMERELSALTHERGEGIEYRAMSSGALTPMDFLNIREAEKRVPPNLILDDCPAVSVDDVRRKVWGLSRRGQVGAICIDYLQLMRKPPARGRNTAEVIGEMTQGLKQMSRQTNVCTLLLSQLSRAVEQRDDKKPQLADLRDSGTIEQDADAVLFPFREHYYLVKAEPKPDPVGVQGKHFEWEMRCEDVRRRMEVFCAKQRQGPEGTDVQRCFAEFDYIEDEN